MEWQGGEFDQEGSVCLRISVASFYRKKIELLSSERGGTKKVI